MKQVFAAAGLCAQLLGSAGAGQGTPPSWEFGNSDEALARLLQLIDQASPARTARQEPAGELGW